MATSQRTPRLVCARCRQEEGASKPTERPPPRGGWARTSSPRRSLSRSRRKPQHPARGVQRIPLRACGLVLIVYRTPTGWPSRAPESERFISPVLARMALAVDRGRTGAYAAFGLRALIRW